MEWLDKYLILDDVDPDHGIKLASGHARTLCLLTTKHTDAF